jgi:hypothetical protein
MGKGEGSRENQKGEESWYVSFRIAVLHQNNVRENGLIMLARKRSFCTPFIHSL